VLALYGQQGSQRAVMNPPEAALINDPGMAS